jgi:hypothetical protein
MLSTLDRAFVVICVFAATNAGCSSPTHNSNASQTLGGPTAKGPAFVHLWWTGDEDRPFPQVVYCTGGAWKPKWDPVTLLLFHVSNEEMKRIFDELSSKLSPGRCYQSSVFALEVYSEGQFWHVGLPLRRESMHMLEALSECVDKQHKRGFETIKQFVSHMSGSPRSE